MAESSTEYQQPVRTAASRYAELETDRSGPLDRARRSAELSIPGIMPPEGDGDSSQLPVPFQSILADGVNNLAAKMTQALFPAGSPFFRLGIDDLTMEKLKARSGSQNTPAAFEDALSTVERSVSTKLEQKGVRVANFEASLHLIVTGNGLLEVLKDNSVKFYGLDRYVVKRDLDGNETEIITKQCLARTTLPPVVRDMLASAPQDADAKAQDRNIDLFTWVRRQDDGSWKVCQEVEGRIVPGTEGTYPKGKNAFIPLRWSQISGRDYGRGRVEEYFGDVVSSETLQKAIVEFAAQAAKVHWMVDENGQTDLANVAEKENGATYHGKSTDVSVLMMEKGQDFQVAKAVLDDVKRRVERAFLSTSAVQRDAERVTAEEIRAMIQELEIGLGGVYTLQATSWQRPLAVRVMHNMTVSSELPALPSDIVAPQIITGMEGLSRSVEVQKLRSFAAELNQNFGPEETKRILDASEYARRLGASLQINMKGLVRTDDQLQQMQQQATQTELAAKLGPSAIRAGAQVQTQSQGE